MINQLANHFGVKSTEITLITNGDTKTVKVNGEDRTEEVKHLLDPQEKLRHEFDQKLEERLSRGVDKWKFEIILEEDGLLDQVNQAVDQIGGRIQKAWKKAATINRYSNAVELLRKQFELTHEQVDNIFQRANNIDI